MGPWQQREHYLALDRQARDPSFGVIPVILPNADPALGFLSLNTWVDLRGGVDDTESMDLLAAAVRGEPPSALLDRSRRAAARVCPYRGLEIFREEDAPFFFGREDFTEKLREAVATRSLIAVVDASGSGKSSVVRAGLVPRLRRPDGGTVWEVVTLVPGQQPLQALAGALLPLLEPEMVEIRPGQRDFPGSFWMGAGKDEPEPRREEQPGHEVTFVRPFAIGKYEVTFEEYELFARLSGREVPADRGWGTSDRPVINVSWEDAVAYAGWLKEETGKSYRLPSEAEWEYAARAETETPFWSGECIHTDQTNYSGESDYNDCGANTGVSRDKTVAAGSLPPNPWGLYEIAGNVYEWVADCWHDSYQGAPADGSAWLEPSGGKCDRRVLRGGSWYFRPVSLRSAYRRWYYAGTGNLNIGFRLARDL